MKQETKVKKAKRLIEEMKKERGYALEEWEFVCREDPDFFEAYNNLYRHSLGKGKFLDIKTKEFIAIAVLSHRGLPANNIIAHIRRAMDHGASRQEILEVIETTINVGGSPTFFIGLNALLTMEKTDLSKKAV
jgi:alkylhydroperoxidase/carboxymuconolactone decarboxylase family protein YurZ